MFFLTFFFNLILYIILDCLEIEFYDFFFLAFIFFIEVIKITF
jgi:hypothetical protein